MLVLSNFFFLYFYSVFPYTYFGFILCYLYYINGTEIIMFRVWGRTFKSNKKSQVVNEFIEKNNYKIVFENQYFILFLPQ